MLSRAAWIASTSFILLQTCFCGCGATTDESATSAAAGTDDEKDTSAASAPDASTPEQDKATIGDGPTPGALDAGDVTARGDEESTQSEAKDGSAGANSADGADSSDLDAVMDGGVTDGDGASEGGKSAGDAFSCEEQAVRCGADSGVRELCVEGKWREEDFVCAVDIRVEDQEGTSCAVKSDGSFLCWSLGGGVLAPEEPPGPVDVVFPVPGGGGQVVWLLDDGTFVDELGNETPGVTDIDVGLGPDHCLIDEDQSATCSRSGDIGVARVVQLATSSTMRCALSESGDVVCDDRHGALFTWTGEYAAIAVAYQTVCAVNSEGKLTCAQLVSTFANSEAPTYIAPLEGSYSKVAMIDTEVCALTQSGELKCATLSGDELYDQPGLFTEIAGGDFVFSAIRRDGSVLSWLNREANSLPEGW